MASSGSFCEKHFGGLVVLIASFLTSFFLSVSGDDGNVLIRELARIISIVDLYFIFCHDAVKHVYFTFLHNTAKRVVTWIASKIDRPALPPPPPAAVQIPDDAPAPPFWQLPATNSAFLRPSGEVQRNKKRFEASERQRLIERKEAYDLDFTPTKPVVRTPPGSLRRAAMKKFADLRWHGYTGTKETTPAPVWHVPAPAPAPAPAQTTKTTVSPPVAKAIAPAPPIISPKLLACGTGPFVRHADEHDGIEEQYRDYLRTAENFPLLGKSLPYKCSFCGYEVAHARERHRVYEMITMIHGWKETTWTELMAAKQTAPARLRNELASYQPFKNMTYELQDFAHFLLFWCTKQDRSYPQIRIPDLTKLQKDELAHFGLVGEEFSRIVGLFVDFDEITSKEVHEYNITKEVLKELMTFFETWPTGMEGPPRASQGAVSDASTLQGQDVYMDGFGPVASIDLNNVALQYAAGNTTLQSPFAPSPSNNHAYNPPFSNTNTNPWQHNNHAPGGSAQHSAFNSNGHGQAFTTPGNGSAVNQNHENVGSAPNANESTSGPSQRDVGLSRSGKTATPDAQKLPQTTEHYVETLNKQDGLSAKHKYLGKVLRLAIEGMATKDFSAQSLHSDFQLRRWIVSFTNWWTVFSAWLNDEQNGTPPDMRRLPRGVVRDTVLPPTLRTKYDALYNTLTASANHDVIVQNLLAAWAPIHPMWNGP